MAESAPSGACEHMTDFLERGSAVRIVSGLPWRTRPPHEARVYRRLEALLLAAEAATWVLALTPQQARRKAGMASKRFWLRNLLQHFWLPT